ncbi:MAG TPA: NAD(P)-dependent alcohol dehydrogenase [Conexibacter sp.]|jgi:uncharacterized zinc-type alcohol dehydrogenase-like protein
MPVANGFAATAPDSTFSPLSFERREVGERDVRIEILFCGVCHSDLHTARGEWPGTVYPVIPGHEIVGRVTEVGAGVGKFALGDNVAVGCMVDSCHECDSCKEDLEQFCEKGATLTYNGQEPQTGMQTFGGYSDSIVVDERMVLSVPDGLDLAATAPLLCAGITTWSPLRHWGVGEGSRVGVVGLGGLGHMGVKLAHALGAEVTLFTTSPSKVEAGKALGADHVVVSTDAEQMKAVRGTLDFVLNTVAASHSLDPFIAALKRDGAVVLVGAPAEPHPTPAFGLFMPRRSLSGSMIGGIAETQEMLDFCAEKGIVSDIEMISMNQIDEAYERMLRGDVRFRFVIDMATLEPAAMEPAV